MLRWLLAGLLLAAAGSAHPQRITAGGEPAQLDIRAAGDASIRVTPPVK